MFTIPILFTSRLQGSLMYSITIRPDIMHAMNGMKRY